MQMRPDKFFNLIWAWCVSRMASEDDYEKWKFQMDSPLPWEPKVPITQADMESEGQDFMNAMASLGQ